jgi:hypothetical protein
LGPVARRERKVRSRLKTAVVVIVALAVAGGIWLPCIHLFFQGDVDEYFSDSGMAPGAQAIAAFHLRLWADPELRDEEVGRMRASNAEWDFMGRTFLVLSLANMAIRNPEAQERYLEVMDSIIDETIRLEKEEGIYYFLLPYAQQRKWESKSQRSIFEDGEIAMMIAARRLVAEKEEYKPLLAERLHLIEAYMKESRVLCGESYPDECWTFCNSVALAAMKIADVLDGTDHSEFIGEWLKMAKLRLVDKETGLLISSFTFDGLHMDGPEGSSIWLVAHCLQVIDPVFAQDQYDRAKKELSAKILGFGYAKEWPESWRGPMDIDSGPVIPVLDISAGSSGLAFLGAASFGDREYLRDLLTSLNYGGFPERRDGTLRFCASNQVGDSVLLYAMVQGPLWKKVNE